MNSNWKILESIEQLDLAIQHSAQRPVFLFKHSTRCSISSMAMNRLEKITDEVYAKADFYYLDLLKFREVSNAIAEKLQVHHESPQILLVKHGECTFDASHMEIDPKELKEQLD